MKFSKFFAILALTCLLVNPAMVMAGQLQSVKDTIGDSRPSTSTSHAFDFTVATGGEGLKAVQFSFCEEPSGGCTTPDGLSVDSATFSSSTGFGVGDWTLTTRASGVLRITSATGDTLAANTRVNIPFSAITNSQIGADCDGDIAVADNDNTRSSDTCYVQIKTCTDAACTSTVDSSIATYTVVNTITVSARVDPTFTFVVAAVGASTAHNGVTTTVASTSSTLPFSNLTAETPAYAAHDLQVTTNTQGGYVVYMKMATPSEGAGVMQGVYTENNIDPYAATGASWSSPIAWTQPTGTTANTNTGWLGANTSDTDVSGWTGGSAKFGPVETTNNAVMQESSSDNGNTHVYVSYAIEVNVNQPADTYTGTLIYSALPTY